MSILTGHEIRKQLETGGIEVDPLDLSRVQPNSIDLTLGNGVKVYSAVSYLGSVQLPKIVDHGTSSTVSSHIAPCEGLLDVREKNHTIDMEMDESGWIVRPGMLYLMHTHERVHSSKFVTQLNGKSSIARLGIIVHFTAAYGDTGFNGQYTLEVSAMHPVRLYPGMAIAQAVFYICEGEIEDYRTKGHYVGRAAIGAEPSHSYEQFKK